MDKANFLWAAQEDCQLPDFGVESKVLCQASLYGPLSPVFLSLLCGTCGTCSIHHCVLHHCAKLEPPGELHGPFPLFWSRIHRGQKEMAQVCPVGRLGSFGEQWWFDILKIEKAIRFMHSKLTMEYLLSKQNCPESHSEMSSKKAQKERLGRKPFFFSLETLNHLHIWDSS